MQGLEGAPLGPTLEHWLRSLDLTPVWAGVGEAPGWVRRELRGVPGGVTVCSVALYAWDEETAAVGPDSNETQWLLDLIGPPTGLVRRIRGRLRSSRVTPWSRLGQLLSAGWVDPVQFRPVDRPHILATAVHSPVTRG